MKEEKNIIPEGAEEAAETPVGTETTTVNVSLSEEGHSGSIFRKKKKKNPLVEFAKKHSRYIIAFFIPVVVLFAAYATFEVYPFGDMSVLVLDLNGQYVYYFENLRDVLHGSGSPFISFSRNLSGEIMGMYAYYLASPFTLIPMILPRSMMTESLLIMQLCKVGAAAAAFYYYLKHSKSCRPGTCMIFSLLYSLMGYMVVQLMNPMWLDGLIYLPLIVYGIENIIDNNGWLRFIIPLALMYMAHFYIGWMITFFSIIYFLYYYFAGKKVYTLSFKSFFISGIKFALGGIISALCAAWVLLPLYYSLKLGKFEFSTPSYEWKTQFDFLDFFKNLLPNVYDTCRPEGSPVVYCGVITIILVPLFYLNSKIRFRQKMGMTAVLMSVLASMYLSTADLAWHGFQVPNWLPYRYSFTFCFILLIMAAMTFERLEGITEKDIGVTGFALIVYAFYVGKQGFDGVDLLKSVWYSVLFTFAYCVFLRAVKLSSRTARAVITYILGVFIAGELFGTSLTTMHAIDEDVTYSKYSSYNRYITLGRETVEKIYETDPFEESGFYRIEKNYHRTVNDAMAMGSFGISHSSSTLNSAPIQFLRRMGFSYGGHYIKYKGSTYVTDALLGIKYVMEKGMVKDEELPSNKHYDTLLFINEDQKPNIKVNDNGEEEDKRELFAVYENPYALPMGFMADKSVLGVYVDNDNPFTNQNQLLSYLISDTYTEYFKEIPVSKTVPENAKQSSYGAHVKYTPIEEGKNSHIEFFFNPPTDDIVYFYMPSNYERKVNLWLNKDFLDYYFEGGNMVIQTLGRFEPGEEVSFITTIASDKNEVLYKDKLFYYLDEEKFHEAIDTLRQHPLNITEFREDHIKGNITADKDGIMFTTISWEPGWTVKVDGQKVEPVKLCNALIGVNITAGYHEIEMTFFPEGMAIGIICSVSGVIAIIMIAVIGRKPAKTKKYMEEDSDE